MFLVTDELSVTYDSLQISVGGSLSDGVNLNLVYNVITAATVTYNVDVFQLHQLTS